jgi:hypothetical protein
VEREVSNSATTAAPSEAALRTADHLRRFMPLYVFGTVWALMLMLFPTIQNRGGDGDTVAARGSDEVAVEIDDPSGVVDPVAGADGTVTTEVGVDGTPASGGGSTPGAAPRARTTNRTGGGPATGVDTPATGTGTTRGGLECAAGVRQIPISTYAAPCQAKFEGDNGGATHRGVTGEKILILERKAPESANSQAVAAISEGAGFADAETARAVKNVWLDYFNKTYELYGRQVDYQIFDSTGNGTEEAQGKGIEAACNDATAIEKDRKAFAVFNGSIPFAQCAGERQLPVFTAAAYYPESFYRKYHPYLYHVIMECERIAYQVAEYIGKRLHGKPARFAGDAALQGKTRAFGTYVPDNDGYQQCVDLTEKTVKEEYGANPGPRYSYQLDVSRFPDQAAQAAVLFKSEGVTTVILACDPISIIFLTQAATNQEYSPEWFLIGVALQDTDNFGRSYDQAQVDGHMFGMSQLGATEKVLGPNSEPGRLFKQVTGQDIPPGTDGDYFLLTHMYNLLQAAGPNLNPQTMDAGGHALPPGGAPAFPLGYWSLADGPNGQAGATDHTEIDDSREIYYVGSATSKADGKKGAFLEVNGGQRYRNGEWPKTDPAVYPKG